MESATDTAKPIRTLIVDDESLGRSLLASLARRDGDLEVIGECEDGRKALRAIARDKPELVFLDVQMPVLNGIQVVEGLRDQDHMPYVVFVTAYDEFAVQAFELNVLDYLLKPVEKTRFALTVERAKNAIRQRKVSEWTSRLVALSKGYEDKAERTTDESLTVMKGGQIIGLSVSDILWLEAANQYVRIHTVNDSYLVAESLSAYHRRLRASDFIRVHRSAVINGSALEKVFRKRNGTHSLVLTDGTEIPLARSRKPLVAKLLKYCREEQRHGT